LVDSLGAEYVSSKQETPQQLLKRVGTIDLVYEAVGVASVSFDLLQVLAINGIFIFTGIPGPQPPINAPLDKIMRELVLKNQAVLGTVNADLRHFQGAVDDLRRFQQRWPEQVRAMITSRHRMESYREVLCGDPGGIKNVIAVN
jgi:threonine dehydrogenase-like Zn-dependent dehydrogenase